MTGYTNVEPEPVMSVADAGCAMSIVAVNPSMVRRVLRPFCVAMVVIPPSVAQYERGIRACQHAEWPSPPSRRAARSWPERAALKSAIVHTVAVRPHLQGGGA